jgi:hypothetical protein
VKEVHDQPNLESATREVLTARVSSMGSSGGTTLVTIRTQSNKSFAFFWLFSRPDDDYK